MSYVSKHSGQFEYFDALLGQPGWRGKQVLDLGGNAGNILLDPNCTIEHDKYWCIDVSRDAIEQGRRRYPEAHFIYYDRYNFQYNPGGVVGLEVPAPRHKFHYVLAMSVFTHTTRGEMFELVKDLESLLVEGGVLAFTFLDPHYVPAGEDVSNLEWYWPKGRNGGRSSVTSRLPEEVRAARWCTLANADLYVEHEHFKPYQTSEKIRNIVFYTAEYMGTLFPRGEILAPVEARKRQHCCLINAGRT
jgi:SAM-dependent methyltransferase